MKTTLLFARKKMSAVEMIGYLAILFVLSPWNVVIAQRNLPTNDWFDYATGALQTVGQDWTRISGTGNDLLVTTGNVTCNGYLGAVGRKCTMANGANDDLKLTFVSQSTVGTTLFTAFTINVANITGLTSSGTYCFILGSGTNNFAARIFIKLSGSGYLIGISKTSTAPSSWSSVLPVTTPQLIVMSYEIKSGASNDMVNLWINPSITTVQPSPLFSTSTGTDFGGGSTIDGFILRQAAGTPNVSLDDISISTSWADLMKNPVFTSSGSIGTGTYNNLHVSGTSTLLTLNGNISIQGTFQLDGGSVSLGLSSLTYGSNGVLKYIGSTQQTTTLAEFPSSGGPASLVIENSAGIIMNLERTINGNFTVANGSFFTINPMKSLTVQGNASLNGPGCLVIKSDPSGTGSFIDHGIVSVPGGMIAERYLSGYGSNDDMKYHFISSPVEDQSIQPAFVANPPDPTTDFYSWHEDLGNWMNSKNSDGSWNNSFDATFTEGTGYLTAYSMDGTKLFNGKPNSFQPSAPLVVTCSNTSNGWNLLGNPFPSPVDWELLSRGNGIDHALYYYDAYIQNYRYYIQYQPGIAVGNGSRYIPAMQGFMVHANNQPEKTVSFSNESRVHSGQGIYYKDGTLSLPILKLAVDNGYVSDELFLCLKNDATPDFDGLYDAHKLKSFNTEVPTLYFITPGNEELSINAIPLQNGDAEAKIGFEPGLDGEFRLIVDETSGVPAQTTLELYDQITGVTHDLLKEPEYHFSAQKIDDPFRFLLKIVMISGEANFLPDFDVDVTYSDEILRISSTEILNKGVVSLYNLEGSLLFRKELPPIQISHIPINLKPGFYLINLVIEGRMVTKKIVVV